MKNLLLLFGLVLSSSAYAEKVTLLVGLALPPYIIQNPLSGIEYDMAKKAMEDAGYELVVRFVPLKRVVHDIRKDKIDGAMTLNDNFKIEPKLFMSEPYVTYQNYAISLENRNISISSIQDLKKYSLASFQNAKIYLGDTFGEMASSHTNYREYAAQIKQNKLLLRNRVDVVIGDGNIFTYYLSKIQSSDFDVNQRLRFSKIFPKTEYKIAFKSKAVRDAFNKALKDLKSKGYDNELYSKYNTPLVH